MVDSGKGITGRVRRAVSDVASAARAVTGGRGRASGSSPPASSGKAAGNTTGKQAASAEKATPPKKTSANVTPATKAAAKKVPAKKATPAKATPSTTAPKKAAPKKAAPKKAAPKKAAPAKRAPAKKAAPVKRVPAKKAPEKRAPAKKAPSTATKKAPPTATTARARKAAPEALVVRADERPWTAAELAEVRTLLETEAVRLRSEISEAESDIADLLRDSTDTGGEDQADTGSKTFEREHEMSLAASHREILGQTERALARIDDGSYGVCESCGNPIGKARLQAFPRATLCMTCKQLEERR